MRRQLLAAAGLCLAAGCLPLQEKDAIVVNGEGIVMATPEIFTISAALQSRAADRGKALEDVAAVLARVQEDLPRLEGLENLKINAASAEVKPVYNFECAKDTYDQDGACPIEGYLATVSLSAVGAPVAAAGGALSLLSAMGAQTTEIDGFSVVDYDALKEKAAGEAMKNAREKAERLATAAGATLGGPTRIQYGEDFEASPYKSMDDMFASDDEIIVTGSRIPAPINLKLSPQPFEVRETVKAAFAIE